MGRLVMQRDANGDEVGIWSLARKGCKPSVSGLLQQPAQFAFFLCQLASCTDCRHWTVQM